MHISVANDTLFLSSIHERSTSSLLAYVTLDSALFTLRRVALKVVHEGCTGRCHQSSLDPQTKYRAGQNNAIQVFEYIHKYWFTNIAKYNFICLFIYLF